jgi:hypothetical protein
VRTENSESGEKSRASSDSHFHRRQAVCNLKVEPAKTINRRLFGEILHSTWQRRAVPSLDSTGFPALSPLLSNRYMKWTARKSWRGESAKWYRQDTRLWYFSYSNLTIARFLCCDRCRCSQRSSAISTKPRTWSAVRTARETTVRQRSPALGAELLARDSFGPAFSATHLGAQLVEQRLGVLQIGGVEALGEPVVDLGEHCAPIVAVTLPKTGLMA